MSRHARPRAPSKPVPPTPAPTSQETESTVEPIRKSDKLANVCYDIRGPVLQKAKQMEDEGHKIIKLNIGNLAPFGFDAPEEIQLDMIRNLPNAAGYSDSKGIFSARKAIMHYTQQKHIRVLRWKTSTWAMVFPSSS